MILPLSPPDSGQAVCVWGQWSSVGWVRGQDVFWWMGREQFQVWLPLEAQSSEETLPKPGEAPSPSQLDCKLLQWCLRVHDPRGPAALRDEVTEAVEQPRGGGLGGGHRATARLLLSPPGACRARPHPCSLSPGHGRTRGRTRGRTWGVGPGCLWGGGQASWAGVIPRRRGAAGAGRVALPKRSRATHSLLCSGLPGRTQHPQGRPCGALGVLRACVCVCLGCGPLGSPGFKPGWTPHFGL